MENETSARFSGNKNKIQCLIGGLKFGGDIGVSILLETRVERGEVVVKKDCNEDAAADVFEFDVEVVADVAPLGDEAVELQVLFVERHFAT